MEQKYHNTGREDTFLYMPPLYHTGSKFHWMGSLVAGSKAVLLKGTKPEIILSAVSNEHCTIVWLLVSWVQDILDAMERGDLKKDDYQLEQWHLMHIGAQPVPPSLIKRWKGYFPVHDYDTNYGLSESTGPGCVHLGMENIHKVGAIGVPGYRGQCKVVDEDGFYFLVDRKKDMAVIALPDRRLGEKTAAIIEIKEGLDCTVEEIEEFALGMLRYKRAKEIIFAEIPRNATGKIEKPRLRKIYGAEFICGDEYI